MVRLGLLVLVEWVTYFRPFAASSRGCGGGQGVARSGPPRSCALSLASAPEVSEAEERAWAGAGGRPGGQMGGQLGPRRTRHDGCTLDHPPATALLPEHLTSPRPASPSLPLRRRQQSRVTLLSCHSYHYLHHHITHKDYLQRPLSSSASPLAKSSGKASIRSFDAARI